MTFKSWKKEVFRDPAADVYIYGAFNPAQKTLFSNIQKEYSAKDIMAVFEKYKVHIKETSERKTQDLLYAKDREMQMFPKQMLVDCLSELEEKQALEPSVSDFFKRYTNSTESNID